MNIAVRKNNAAVLWQGSDSGAFSIVNQASRNDSFEFAVWPTNTNSMGTTGLVLYVSYFSEICPAPTPTPTPTSATSLSNVSSTAGLVTLAPTSVYERRLPIQILIWVGMSLPALASVSYARAWKMIIPVLISVADVASDINSIIFTSFVHWALPYAMIGCLGAAAGVGFAVFLTNSEELPPLLAITVWKW